MPVREVSSSAESAVRSTRLNVFLSWLLAAAPAAAIAYEADTTPLRVALAAPTEEGHFAWGAGRELERVAADKGVLLNIGPAPLTDASNPDWDLMILPVRSLATQVPALEILELPFFYPSLAAVRSNLDGALGKRLAADAGTRGWQILAFWDEGMHIMSGLKRFDRVRNLKAREFLITRSDPVAERQFGYWKADARRIASENREAVLRECLIASRATTLQEVMREQLYRVHLSMSLTNHRYEGWLVIAPVGRWKELDPPTREAIERALKTTKAWQRHDADARAGDALAELKRLGMTIHEVDEVERAAFRAALPDWAELLSDDLSAQQKRELIELVSTGTTAFVSTGPAAAQPGTAAPPDSEGHQ